MIATSLPAPESEPRAAAGGPAAQSATVLIVDDLRMSHRLVGKIVEGGGYKVITAGNGRQALEVIERQPPTVVLTDLHMPEMDGLELVTKVREKYPLLPVVLMTAGGSEEIALQALRNGAASYVPKRNLGDDLLRILHEVVASARVGHQRHMAMSGLTRRESHFRLGNDLAVIPAVVTLLQDDLAGMGLCDDTACIRVGVALQEAMREAICRGNLEIDPQSLHGDEAAQEAFVRQRAQLARYRLRQLHVTASLDLTAASFVVRHEGESFQPFSAPDATNPANLEKDEARGFLLIHTFMDKVVVNGNQIRMIKNRDRGPS
jgi:CheY-like chemotaxis protein